jgi:RNA polymerase sigma factor (sigma-70 family)
LVERASTGDEGAFAELVALEGDLCYAIAYRILRDPGRAQDAVQQAFLLAWRELPRLRDPDRFGPWLHRLLVNACYQEARRFRRWSQHVRELPAEWPGSKGDMVSVEDREVIQRAFLRLSPELRAVVVLHHYTGLPLADVSEAVGVPLGTVKSRLHNATQKLRAAITADLDGAFGARPA